VVGEAIDWQYFEENHLFALLRHNANVPSWKCNLSLGAKHLQKH
jgi:hypothetical protein